MRFRRGARLDTGQVQDVRGRGRGLGGGLAAGGGGLGLAVLVVYLLFAVLGSEGGLRSARAARGSARRPGRHAERGLDRVPDG